MKRQYFAGMMVLQSLSVAAFAESPPVATTTPVVKPITLTVTTATPVVITIYGSVDNGVTYINNIAGKSSTKMQDGINKSNALGFSGSVDLGGGQRGFFKLENGFSLNTGTMGQGLVFGKQAYVGIGDARIGEISIGRQYDYTLQLERYMPYLNCGIMLFQNADLDRVSGQRLNNAIQYTSANFVGFTFGAMYASSDTTGTTSANIGRAISANVQYKKGSFSAAFVYTDINKTSPVLAGATGVPTLLGVHLTPTMVFPVDNQSIKGVAAMYTFGDWRTSTIYTNTKLQLNNKSATDQVLHFGGAYRVRPNVELAAKVSLDKLEDSRWYSIATSADYQFLKWQGVDVYVELVGQKATGAEGTVASIAAMGASSKDKQFVTRAGLRIFF